MSRYGGPALTTLELVDYPETILPRTALSSLTSLQSLTVRYRYIREGIECRLPSWLSPLHQLETLSIIGESGCSKLCLLPADVTLVLHTMSQAGSYPVGSAVGSIATLRTGAKRTKTCSRQCKHFLFCPAAFIFFFPRW